MNITADYTKQFEQVYISFFARMKRFAIEYVVHEEDAENVVHEIFLEIWEKKIDFAAINNIGGYLLVSLKNKCIDFIRKKNRELELANAIKDEYYQTLKLGFDTLELLDNDILSDSDISNIVQSAIDDLPPKCREIFVMSKIERKKHKQIAEELGISVKTIEAQITIAYKKLKVSLEHYIALIFFFF